MSTMQSHLDKWGSSPNAKPTTIFPAGEPTAATSTKAATTAGTATGAGGSVLTFTLGVCWLCLFCDYLLLTIAIPIFPELKECQDSDFLTGVLFSAKAVMQILCSPIVSCFVDAHTLELLLGGMLVEGSATLIFMLTDSYALWLVGRATQGVASAAILTSAFAFLQQAYNDDRVRGKVMGAATTGIICGVMVGPPIGGLLYEVWKPAPFAIAMGLCATAGLGVASLRGRRPATTRQGANTAVLEPRTPEQAGGAMAKRMLADRHIVAALGALFVANAAISCLEASVGNFLKDEYGMTTAQVSGPGLAHTQDVASPQFSGEEGGRVAMQLPWQAATQHHAKRMLSRASIADWPHVHRDRCALSACLCGRGTRWQLAGTLASRVPGPRAAGRLLRTGAEGWAHAARQKLGGI